MSGGIFREIQYHSFCFPVAYRLLFCLRRLVQPGHRSIGKVLCFGDSITHAGGYGWVEMLGEQHDYLVTVNAGRSGRKTSDRDELDPSLAANNDSDWVLFFLGVNDLKDGTPEMVGKCVENMEWMIRRVRQKAPGARIVLMAPVDISLEGMNQINTDKKYNQNTRDSLYLMEEEYAELAERTEWSFSACFTR